MVVRKVAGAVRAGLRVVVTVAVAALALPVAAANDDARTGRITYFEPLRTLPAQSSAGQRKAGSSVQQLRFDAFGRRFDLSLGSNDRLMLSKPAHSQLELYSGAIDGIAGSWVRLATKGEVLHGMMWDGTQLYAIEPTAEVRDALTQPLPADAPQTIVFRLADVTMDQGAASCASESSPTRGSDAFAALAGELKSSAVAMQAMGATRRLDVSALSDAKFRARYGSDQEARDAILTRLNNVDGIYSSQLAIEIHVASVAVPDAASDQLSDATVPNTLLRELAMLRKRSPELNSQGLTHLFTSRDLDGTTIGIAYLDSVCDSQNAVGLTESRNVWLDSLVAAHEMGHNFGADHDGDSQGSCPNTPSSGFLMAPVVSGTDDFSPCSLTRMRQRTQRASCITNLPPANVRIASNLGVARRQLGASFKWQLPIANVGGLDSRSVHAELTLPTSLSIVDAGVVGGSCVAGGGAVECELGDIAGGDVRKIELELDGSSAGSHIVTAHVTADHDLDRSDNDGSGTILVEAPADVSVRLHGPTSATANERFTVGFDVANVATDNAGTVTVRINLPLGTTIGGASLSNGTCTSDEAGIECTLTPLGAGSTASGSVSLTAAAEGSAELHATVSGDYFDTDNSNDTADLVVAVSGAAVLATQPPAPAGSGGGGSMGWLLLLALAPLHRARRRGA
jgi:metallopeptidase family M12-like protein/uncharacterized protein DUF11